MKNNIKYLVSGSVLIGSLLFAGTALAADGEHLGAEIGVRAHGMPALFARGEREDGKPGVFGTVASINGDTLTVNSAGMKMRGENASSAVFTVDATNATVFKDNATSTLASVAVGDTVMVAGTVSGTNVTATTIRDGMPMQGGKGMAWGRGHASSTPPMVTGNGEPVIGGSVTSISGTSLTVTNKSNVAYTVDAASSSVSKKGVSLATVSNISVGDNVVIQGVVNGTSVTASTIVDSGANSTTTARHGVLGSIGGFLSRLFGFF